MYVLCICDFLWNRKYIKSYICLIVIISFLSYCVSLIAFRYPIIPKACQTGLVGAKLQNASILSNNEQIRITFSFSAFEDIRDRDGLFLVVGNRQNAYFKVTHVLH